MKNAIVGKVYEFVNHILHGSGELSARIKHISSHRKCPVTGLDISMQPANSKFLSYTGVKWYFYHDRKIYNAILFTRISGKFRNADPDKQFREIAHQVRNLDSNPRNNSRRAIKKILSETNCLFNNIELIDRGKLEKAGMKL